MFIYLSKKIAIPNNVMLHSLSWNALEGWIACGGDNGMLKVLKLDGGSAADQRRGLGAQSNLSMNQTLEGHNGGVMCATWNELYRKLTTSDEAGLIIVWTLYKGQWVEEMINNRNVSTVREMKWSRDGTRIAIAYQDGHVIVGSVDGNRLWGKELSLQLSHLEWSPDGRSLLFGTLDHKVEMYDSAGNYISKLSLVTEDTVEIIGVEWFDSSCGVQLADQPTLAIGFANGVVQLMRAERDERAVVLDIAMAAAKLQWNTTGTMLVVAGSQVSTSSAGERREIALMHFYSPFGQHLRTLKVPGANVAAISFERQSLRLAVAVDSFIYFANIRPAYKWGFFANTVVCALPSNGRAETPVLFADAKTGERVTKVVGELLHVAACADSCVLVTRSRERTAPFYATLCNSLGGPIDSKYLDIEPRSAALTRFHLVCSSREQVYIWQYRTLTDKLTSVAAAGSTLRRLEGREQAFHVDDLAAGDAAAAEGAGAGGGLSLASQRPTADPIVCVCATDRAFFVARESGALLRCSLPHVSVDATYQLARAPPACMHVNCDSTKLAVLDVNGVLAIYSLERDPATGSWGGPPELERKDVWDFRWAADNASAYALMEKTRMFVFSGGEAEEPVLSSAHLCAFAELEITAALLDDLIAEAAADADGARGAAASAAAAALAAKSLVLRFDTKGLRDAREQLGKVSAAEAYALVEARPHPRLWKLVAEAALKARELAVADKAFVRCADYGGVQFVKRLRQLDDERLCAAEVAAFYGRYAEADKIYAAMDRRDLSLELRARLGDWFKVVDAIGAGGGDDRLLARAHDAIGDFYAERLQPAKAALNYAVSKNARGLLACYYRLDDFAQLEALAHALPAGAAEVREIGHKLASVGLAAQAAAALSKAGDDDAAIKAATDVNGWATAAALAEQLGRGEVARAVERASKDLLKDKKAMLAAELFRHAGQPTDAARQLAQLARADAAAHAPPLRVKKLHVLAALQVDAFRKKALDGTMTAGQTTAQTLSGLMQDDAVTGADRSLDSAWRGAEAYHFLCLAQRQLYDGEMDCALRSALRLRDYEGVLEPVEVYSLIALAALYAQCYGQCSRALIKLEALPGPAERREAYERLALAIFTQHKPHDPSVRQYKCIKCDGPVQDWTSSCGSCSLRFPASIVSGRALVERKEVWKCKTCKHGAYADEMADRLNCPLCHSSVSAGKVGSSAPLDGKRAGPTAPRR